MCDKCKKLMEGNKNCKKLNKKEESHYQNAVQYRHTTNTNKPHKQTYSRLQRKTQPNFNNPYNKLKKNPNNPEYAELKQGETIQQQKQTVYNKLKIAESNI